MTDKQLDLLLLGGSHVGDTSDRFKLTKEEFDTVDTLFIESVTDDESLFTIVAGALRAPLIIITAIIVLRAEYLINLIWTGDKKLKEQIVEEYDPEIRVMDKSLYPTINSSPYFWPLSNYGILFGIYTLHTEFAAIVSTAIASGYVAIVTFMLYLAATLYGRDAQMALDIEQHAQTNSGNACAIVGTHHEEGLTDRLSDSPNVQIVPRDS